MTIVSPSLLSCDFLNIEKEVLSFKNLKNIWFHLDIMDGHFVPNLTFGHPIVEKLSSITEHPLDAHFMVTNPEFYIHSFKNYKIYNFTFHYEACSDSIEVIRLVKLAKQFYPSVGVSIKPNTQANVFNQELLTLVDLILVMSVEPGFGGQIFMNDTWAKLDELKSYRNTFNLKYQIQVDGGVSDSNSKKLIEHGADNLVAGSYIFKNLSSDYENAINKLKL
jgi:ribulose-phosphate 3-epimerase